MMTNIKNEHILFLDIETVPEYATYQELSADTQKLWANKTKYKRGEEYTAEQFYDRAGIWAEFGKIVCVSVGCFTSLSHKNRSFRITSFAGDEQQLLLDFKNLLDTYFCKPHHLLCAHNGKEFDFPYIARRMVIHQVEIPKPLQMFGKKPWEIPHLDTMELWKFGDYKHYTSLKLLTSILNIPSPKDDIDGSEVGSVFYKENNLKRIVDYCEKDVIAIAQVFLRYRRQALLAKEEVVYINK